MLGVVPSPASVPDFVAERLDHFLSRMRTESADYGPDALGFLDAAAATLDGGKRLRARFCHAGWRSIARFRDRDALESEALWDVCAALEIFQSAALVHDDLIDNSDTRRGRPAAHRALEESHRSARWAGDAEAFGRASAVLLGDLLVAWSDDLLESALDGHPHARTVRSEYARMRRDVTTGQFLDVAEESAWRVSAAESHAARALRVASLKSARYSIEQPLVLGSALAGADDDQVAALRRFGHPVGMAFQLRDDILGVFGDAAVTGKPAGDDLREGKRTVLVALTREALDASARSVLDEMLGDRELTREQVSFVQATVADSGALDRVEAMIADYAREADRALSGARLDNAAVGELRDLARAATVRSA
ncbi:MULTISPECIES: polyprenyl synthetase family protein [unclassified Microbacterium]|uniref:polyprenyl synthetase family protein n=1 Tax=unclassified Microbacterium TaxID=2609290 RepID=UPI000EA8F965|nr:MULTISPECIES: polyprenyl synthetase family protein [unclassified Microbacterium]MBT2486349.1 polyprenyl synthetase family protein [Microbacterium sp. ISL-108]RKN69060.1 polyprenyl synthetase family protein [Microbacterium sp. CGR2]